VSDHELVLYEDGEIALQCYAKSEGPDSPPCWYDDKGKNMGSCNAVTWVENDGIDLSDAIRNPNATGQVVVVALKDKDWHVRLAAAKNRNATEQVLLEAVRDEYWGVREAAAEHPNATERVRLEAISEGERR
jgi:hypothetical protein